MTAPRCRALYDGRLSIVSAPGWIATLFGLPFLVAGLYFVWQLVGAVMTYFTQVAPREFGMALVGFAVIVMLAATFGVPGLLLVLFRKRVLIDAQQGTVTDTKDFYFFRRSRTHELAAFDAVTLEYREYGSSTDSDAVARYCWFVELRGRPAQPVLLGMCDKKEEAQDVGRAVAEATALPLRKIGA